MLQERHRDIKPTYDMVAKKIFSDTEITRHFIEDMLDLKIEEVQILDGNQIHLANEDELTSNFYTTVDVLAQLETGVQVIIEIQIVKQRSFFNRLWAYICSQVYENLEQIRRQQPRTHTIYKQLAPVYAIAIVEKNYFSDNRAFRVFSLQDSQTQQELKVEMEGQEGHYPLVQLALLELKKYNLDIESHKKQWLEFFSNQPFSSQPESIIRRAEDLLDMSRWSKEDKAMFDEKRRQSEIRLEEEDTWRYEGRQEGRQEGILEGRQEGKQETILDLVREHLLSPEIASQKLGLTVSELEALL